METLVPPNLTPSGIGIGRKDNYLWALSPCCTNMIYYKSSPHKRYCSECEKELKFPEVSQGAISITTETPGDIQWLARQWTGLDQLEVKISERD